MERYTMTDILKILKEKKISLFTLADFGRLLNISNRQTLYKRIQRMEEKELIKRLTKGKYLFLFNKANDFTIANYLYRPSYVSLESALSFYGIATGFPYKIFSLTTKKSRLFNIDGGEYQFCQINPRLFWGYEKKEDFLIADKEKALLDYLYFYLKGLRVDLEWQELDLSEINRQKLIQYAKDFNHQRLLTLVRRKII